MAQSRPRSVSASPSVSQALPVSSRNGHFIVAYDVACPKRLRKIANCCLDHGFRLQYSVFECRLSWSQFDQFWEKLVELADTKKDRLFAFPIHASTLHQVRRLGEELALHPMDCYVF